MEKDVTSQKLENTAEQGTYLDNGKHLRLKLPTNQLQCRIRVDRGKGNSK